MTDSARLTSSSALHRPALSFGLTDFTVSSVESRNCKYPLTFAFFTREDKLMRGRAQGEEVEYKATVEID